MEGNRYDGNRIDGKTNWKQSVIRNNPHDSRIFASSGEQLLNKFSPSRPAVSPKNRSLFRSKLQDFSQDEARSVQKSTVGKSSPNQRMASPRVAS